MRFVPWFLYFSSLSLADRSYVLSLFRRQECGRVQVGCGIKRSGGATVRRRAGHPCFLAVVAGVTAVLRHPRRPPGFRRSFITVRLARQIVGKALSLATERSTSCVGRNAAASYGRHVAVGDDASGMASAGALRKPGHQRQGTNPSIRQSAQVQRHTVAASSRLHTPQPPSGAPSLLLDLDQAFSHARGALHSAYNTKSIVSSRGLPGDTTSLGRRLRNHTRKLREERDGNRPVAVGFSEG